MMRPDGGHARTRQARAPGSRRRLLARVHDLRWYAFGGFCAAFALGTYMLWKIIRTPGEL